MINGFILIGMIWTFISIIALAALNPTMKTDKTTHMKPNTNADTDTTEK